MRKLLSGLTIFMITIFIAGCYPRTTVSFNTSEYPRKQYVSKYCFVGCLKQIRSEYAFEYCASVCDEDIDAWERL